LAEKKNSTGAKIFAAVFAVAAIAYTYPRVAEMLRDGTGSSALSGRPPHDTRSAEARPASIQSDSREPRREFQIPPPGAHDMGPDPKPYHWQERVLRVPDYADFVREALPAAEKGNGDAQFALYGAFAFCRDGMRKRTTEERSRIPAELWEEMHRRCDALTVKYPDPSGEAEAWLQRALAAKFPRAIAYEAIEDLERIERGETRGGKAKAVIAAAKPKLVAALASNDPAITEGISMKLQTLFPGDPRALSAYWVWRLAACEQGLDCGPDVGWLHTVCTMRDNCIAGETGERYIRRVSGDLSSLQARARDMARKLRKGEFTLTDLEESVTTLPQPRTETSSRPAARLN
jgi:hypothetical protein